MKVSFTKDARGKWWYKDQRGTHWQPADTTGCMEGRLGIYTPFEATLKLPIEDKENNFYLVTCKQYAIVKVELLVEEGDEGSTLIEVESFELNEGLES